MVLGCFGMVSRGFGWVLRWFLAFLGVLDGFLDGVSHDFLLGPSMRPWFQHVSAHVQVQCWLGAPGKECWMNPCKKWRLDFLDAIDFIISFLNPPFKTPFLNRAKDGELIYAFGSTESTRPESNCKWKLVKGCLA